MDLHKEFNNILDLKGGSQELALFYERYPESNDGDYDLLVGNESEFVRLGEISGEFESSGDTVEECIAKIKLQIAREQSSSPWKLPNEHGELPGDICCQRATGKYCYEHDPKNYGANK
jgi:hypothetical protein